MSKVAGPDESSFKVMLAEIQARKKVSVPPAKTDWMKYVGWAKDDPVYDEAMRLGAEWRAEVNRKSIEEFDALHGHP